MIPTYRFLKIYFLIYSFTILFKISKHFSVPTMGLPPTLAAIDYSLLSTSCPPFSTICLLFTPGFSCGANNHVPLLKLASRRERKDLLRSDFKLLGCLRKCSRQLSWAGRFNWTLTVAEAVSIILFTKLLNKISFELFIPGFICDFVGRSLWTWAGIGLV